MGPLRRDDPRDDVLLAQSPALAHVAGVLPAGRRCTAGQLVSAAPVPVAAPNPRDLLLATRAANPPAAGEPLRVLVWNLALLDTTLFGVVPYRKSPKLPERRAVLPALVARSEEDILLLQEVWTEADRQAIESAAAQAGFVAFHCARRRYTDGVVTLVRRDLVRGGPTGGATPYADSDPLEFFPGPRIRRGFVETSFEHTTLGPVRLFNTHLLAWPKNWRFRLRQARQLGRRVAAGSGLVLAGGDFNAAPYYPRDTWVHRDGRAEPGWWGNALSWAVLQHYGGVQDLAVRGAEDPLRDITLMDALRPGPDGRVDVRAHAALTRHPAHFSATDENSLYAEQYLGKEYPSRIDQLFARDPDGRVHVAEVRPKHAEVLAELGCEASDHTAWSFTLRIAPAR